MNVKTRSVAICLMIVLLLSVVAPAFAFYDSVADKPLCVLGGEVEIHFKVISDNPIYNSADAIRTSLYWEPWETNMLYEKYSEYSDATQDQAEITSINEQGTEYTVLFHKPGRYQIGDARVYILDPENEALAAVGTELCEAIEQCQGKNQKETASLLRKWIVKKIKYGNDSSDYPERAQYDDPIGVLITGKALCTGYSALYQLMAEMCGIRATTLTVEVKRNREGHVLNLNRLDGEWSFTDVTWEDGGSSCKNTYFAMDEKKMNKYFTIPDYVEIYHAWFSSPEQIQKLNNLLDF